MLEFNATFFIGMFSFIIFMIIMNSILYKPLERIAKERESLISKNHEDAKTANEQRETLKKQHEESVDKSRILAKEIYKKKISEYKVQKENILINAKTLLKRDLAILSARLGGDEREAKLLLKDKITDLASSAASKILGFEVTAQKPDDGLLNSYLE